MKKLLLIVGIILLLQPARAEEKKEEKPFKVELHGFVGVSAFYDSRQSVAPRNGHIYLYPTNVSLDANGDDINAAGRYDIDPSYSRFGLHISGPNILGAKSFALMEGDFLGKSGSNDLNFRLRHAMVRLKWQNSYLLMGQYWHPMFVTEIFPSLVGLDPGIPYNPFARSAQVRFGYNLSDKMELNGALVAQNTFKNAGMPEGDEWSQLPELDVQMKYVNNSFVAAVTAGAKSVQPLLSENNLVTKEKVNSYHFSAVARNKFEKVDWKVGYTYGGNMSNMVMLGGVGRKTSSGQLSEYAAIYAGNFWTDFQTNGKDIQPGIFFGYSKVKGAGEEISVLSQYGLGRDIGYLYSFAPRVKFILGKKIFLGLQYEYTVAGYGDDFDENGVPVEIGDVANHRTMISLRYTF